MSTAATFTWQPDLPLFDPTEPRILPQDAGAWFTLNWLSPAGKLNQQKAFQLDDLETVLRLTAGQQNLYMSQCMLDRPVRQSPFVLYGTHAYVDLDTYRIPGLAGLSRDGLARDIRMYCDDTGTPPPSAIISSGRGIYAKWYWAKPVGRDGVGRMMGVNRALVRRLDRFGADPKATDCTRILRITGSEHAKAKRLVSLLHLEQRDGHTVTYDFDAFARQIAPIAATEPDREAQLTAPAGPVSARTGIALNPDDLAVADIDRAARVQRGGRVFTREGWHWTIVEDCRTLARIRWGGMVPPGWRDIFGHAVACQLARIFRPENLYREIVAHAGLMLPRDYVARDLAGHCSSLLRLAREATPYRYRKTTLIELLRITPAEERHMGALISDTEKDRRDAVRQRARRRAAGMTERSIYEANATERARPWETEGISRATWYRRHSATAS
jgi:hypothetical protein